MTHSIVDKILMERELKNEKIVSIVRFLPIVIVSILDYLAFFNITSFTQTTPTITTLILDSVFVIYSTIVLIILLKNIYLKYLKFFVIFLDYLMLAFLLLFDTTVPEEKSIFVWASFVGTIFFYFINLLRYSKAGTIYAGILSIAIFVGINIYSNTYQETDIIMMGISLLMFLFIGYLITTSNKKMMIEANTKKMMERYLSPQLVGELYKAKLNLEAIGKKQTTTILFSDIRDFTSISEQMSAEEVVTILNQYLSTMTDIIFKNEGTIDKFIGDAIMTVFGAPVSHSDDPLRAIKTAIEMNKALIEFNKKYTDLKIPIKIGIGINTGEVIAGSIGSDKRLDYTVIGDSVNLSSRIEGLTKYYKCPILISENTYKQISNDNNKSYSDLFCLREVDSVIVKGKTEHIKIYDVMYFDNNIEKEKKESIKMTFEKGLQHYKIRKFQEAIDTLKNIQDDELSKIYIKRCEHFIKNPPDNNWNGIYAFQEK